MRYGADAASRGDVSRRLLWLAGSVQQRRARAVAVGACLMWLPACSTPRSPAVLAAGAAASPSTSVTRAVQARYVRALGTLAERLDTLAAIADTPADRAPWPVRMQAAFVSARDAYKCSETLFEYENGVTAQELNGAAVPETEENDGIRTSNDPTGFQVVEEALFPVVTRADSTLVRYQIEVMQSLVRRATALARSGSLSDANLFDAVRLQIARVSVLALANADTPVAERGLHEGAVTLDGMQALLEPLRASAAARAPGTWAAWEAALQATRAAMDSAEPRRADRLELTRIHLVPLATRWNALRQALGVPLPADARAWRGDVAGIFDRDAFDAWQFAPAIARGANIAAAAALGAELFVDGRLSADGTRSCQSCHDPALAFTDGRVRSLARTDAVALRNAPTLVNAALQRLQFADARAMFLEDQVADVVANTHELGGALDAYAKRIGADPRMRSQFARSFGAAGDSTVTAMRVARALAAYERTLIAMNSPFDRYVRGDTSAMTVPARRGYSVFMGKGKCGTCHFAPLFNGTVPPAFTRGETEVIGTPGTPGWRGVRPDADSGRARVYSAPAYLRAFKTPTIRNVARTGPYMHNGVYRTLDEVVEFYDRGGGAGLGLDVPNQTLPFDRLRLTAQEKRELVAFMEALTDLPPGRPAAVR